MATRDANPVTDIALQAFFGVASHPFAHAKVLMQLGYEPNPPFESHTIWSVLGFGSKSMRYPSVFQYWSSMSEDIGVVGIFFYGLPARMLHSVIVRLGNDAIYQRVEEHIKPKNPNNQTVEELGKEVAARCGARIFGLVLAYPFNVVFIRQVAQIVGKESYYGGIHQTIYKIWSDEGIAGFYGGFTARTVAEIFNIVFTTVAAYSINKYILQDPSLKDYVFGAMAFLSGNYSYKYQVISTVLSTTHSKLAVASKYTGFFDCYQSLHLQGELNRGGSLILRYKPVVNKLKI